MDQYEEFAAGDAALLRALRSYDEYRGGIPPAGRQEVLQNLQRFPREDWAAVLDQSVQRRWKNLYPLKKASVQTTYCRTLEDQYRKYGPIGPKLEALKQAMKGWIDV